MIGWLKRRFTRRAPERETDPLAAWDERLQVLSRRTSDLRRSAATLLAMRGELERGLAQAESLAEEARRKAADPAAQRIAAVLEEDAAAAERRAESIRVELERVEVEAAAIAETVQTLEREAEQLRRERTAAAARFAASRAMHESGGERARVEGLLALDRARDEAERAQALLEIAREDAAARKGRE